MEIWKAIPGWENLYEVSNMGRVRSIPRNGETTYGKRIYGGKILKPINSRNNYLRVNLTHAGKRYQNAIHRIVLIAFVGDAPAGMEACHNDGNKYNNCLNNLRWDTCSANHMDQFVHGTRAMGESHGNSVATKEIVLYIRNSKETDGKLAEKFGMGRSTIYNIKHNRTWKHVK